jgi:hypothetical protein
VDIVVQQNIHKNNVMLDMNQDARLMINQQQ